MPQSFIRAVAAIKAAAAEANSQLELLDRRIAFTIVQAADEIIAGKHADQFPVDVYQTGSGTSTNMNVNEVIAARAREILKADVSKLEKLGWRPQTSLPDGLRETAEWYAQRS